MADDVTTVASPLSSVPPGTTISAQQETSGALRQNLRLVDATKDSTNALAISGSGEASTADATARTSLASILAKLTSDPATQTTLAAILAKITSDPATQTTLAAILVALQGTLAVSAASLPLPSGASTASNQSTEISALAAILSDTDGILAKLSSDPATQTTLASILTKLNASIAVTGTFFPATQPISATALPLPTGASTETTVAAILAKIVAAPALDASVQALVAATDFDSKVGILTETAPASDTASSGLNGRLQRIAQRITSLLAVFTSSTPTLTNVNAAASDTALLASNASRKQALFFNDSTAILYLSFGSSAASTTAYSVQIAAAGYYEAPQPVCTSAIRGIWAAANGAVRITEVV